MSYSLKLCLFSGTAALLLGACGGDSQPANHPSYAVQCPPGQVFDGQYCVMQSPVATGGAAATADVTRATGGAGAAAPTPDPALRAVPLDAVQAAAATQLIAPLAEQHAPDGAQPLGPAVAGQFQAGQALEQAVQLQPGRCYTVVGVGLPPVQDLDLELVTDLAGMAQPVLAEDKTDGPSAVLGAKPNCFVWALPAAPAKLVVRVQSGQGVAAAQVYVK
jgi:hypothetical protein